MLTNGERDFVASAVAPVEAGLQEQDEEELDMRGVAMPRAYLRLRRALDRLQPGGQLVAASDDRESLRGFIMLARLCKRDVLETREIEGDFLFVFRGR